MATGSREAAKQRLQAAGFTTGRPQHEPRCSSCKQVEYARGGVFGGTKYDRYCKLLQAGVKTHGHCRMFAAGEVQR